MASVALLRRARRDERKVLGRLLVDAYEEFEPFLTPGNWAQMMTNLECVVMNAGDDNLLVAEVDGRLAGTVTYYPPGPKDYTRVPPEWAVIRALAVHPACRRWGVARVLTEECLRRAREDHACWVGLHTSELMVAARTMYEEMGVREQHSFKHLDISFSIYALALELPPRGAPEEA